MIKHIKNYNCWTMEIGEVNAIRVFGWVLELISLRHIWRVYKRDNGKYTKDAWKYIVKGVFHREYYWNF